MTIRTLNYGLVPVAVDTTYISDGIVDTVETCNGDFYTIRLTFTGSIVAVKELTE